MSACAALGDHLDVPAISQTSGNTLACRTYYLERVPHDPATNCPLTAATSARCN